MDFVGLHQCSDCSTCIMSMTTVSSLYVCPRILKMYISSNDSVVYDYDYLLQLSLMYATFRSVRLYIYILLLMCQNFL